MDGRSTYSDCQDVDLGWGLIAAIRGQGLGKDGSGRSAPVAMTLKFDKKGVRRARSARC